MNVDEVPAAGENDVDFDRARDMLFRDHDVRLLYNASMDGIENDADYIAQRGIAYIHPRDWFRPFGDVT